MKFPHNIVKIFTQHTIVSIFSRYCFILIRRLKRISKRYYLHTHNIYENNVEAIYYIRNVGLHMLVIHVSNTRFNQRFYTFTSDCINFANNCLQDW